MPKVSSDRRKPKVVLVTADHWSGPLLGAAGHSTIQTPTIDQLARNGMRFARAYSECPVCIPARRTLMTGTSPRTRGDRVFNETQRMPAFPTLASAFAGAGYRAQAVGKLHVYPQRDRIGFDDVQLVEEGRSAPGAIDDYDIFLADWTSLMLTDIDTARDIETGYAPSSILTSRRSAATTATRTPRSTSSSPRSAIGPMSAPGCAGLAAGSTPTSQSGCARLRTPQYRDQWIHVEQARRRQTEGTASWTEPTSS